MTVVAPKSKRKPKPEPVAAHPDAPASKQEVYSAMKRRPLAWRNLDWKVVGWMVAMHLGCLAAPFFVSWSAVGVALLLHWLTASIGICLCYHRTLSHRSLKLRQPARFFAMLCGAVSAEGSPLVWTAVHRLHHERSDEEGDPHSPLEGRFWAHIWWMQVQRAERVEEALLKRYTPDLADDKLAWFFHRTFGLWAIGLGVALYLMGGLPWLIWGMCVRTVACYHSTWFVNSATHLWGYRNYETRDESRNLWWVAILAYGEGWHNNHHAHPALARAGHRWWEVDPTFMAIRALQFCGLAYDVKDGIPARA